MGSRHIRRSLAFLCLAAALCAALAVTVLVIFRGEDLRRRYHFEKWKAIVLNGVVNAEGPEPLLSLSREQESVAWRHLMILQNAEGYDFLLQRVLEGGERDAAGAAIALGSIYDNLRDTRQPIASLILAHEHALRARAEGPGSPCLGRVIRDLYTECSGGPKSSVRNVKRSTPRPTSPASGS